MNGCSKLAAEIVTILEKSCLAGCKNKSWQGYENGNGIECGKRIDRLIKKAKRIVKNDNI